MGSTFTVKTGMVGGRLVYLKRVYLSARAGEDIDRNRSILKYACKSNEV